MHYRNCNANQKNQDYQNSERRYAFVAGQAQDKYIHDSNTQEKAEQRKSDEKVELKRLQTEIDKLDKQLESNKELTFKQLEETAREFDIDIDLKKYETDVKAGFEKLRMILNDRLENKKIDVESATADKNRESNERIKMKELINDYDKFMRKITTTENMSFEQRQETART